MINYHYNRFSCTLTIITRFRAIRIPYRTAGNRRRLNFIIVLAEYAAKYNISILVIIFDTGGTGNFHYRKEEREIFVFFFFRCTVIMTQTL